MNLEHHEKWITLKRYILSQYQHYRAIRVKIFNTERIDELYYDYPEHLIEMIEEELIPAIQAENYLLIKDITARIEEERLKWEYKK